MSKPNDLAELERRRVAYAEAEHSAVYDAKWDAIEWMDDALAEVRRLQAAALSLGVGKAFRQAAGISEDTGPVEAIDVLAPSPNRYCSQEGCQHIGHHTHGGSGRFQSGGCSKT